MRDYELRKDESPKLFLPLGGSGETWFISINMTKMLLIKPRLTLPSIDLFLKRQFDEIQFADALKECARGPHNDI